MMKMESLGEVLGVMFGVVFLETTPNARSLFMGNPEGFGVVL